MYQLISLWNEHAIICIHFVSLASPRTAVNRGPFVLSNWTVAWAIAHVKRDTGKAFCPGAFLPLSMLFAFHYTWMASKCSVEVNKFSEHLWTEFADHVWFCCSWHNFVSLVRGQFSSILLLASESWSNQLLPQLWHSFGWVWIREGMILGRLKSPTW